jgi:hypothetical protein
VNQGIMLQTLTTIGDRVNDDSSTRLVASTIRWYDFANQTDLFNSGLPAAPKALPADTFGDSVFPARHPFYSAVMESAPVGSNNVVAHVTAHETGHQVDAIYGNAGVVRGLNIKISGTVTPTNIITIVITDQSLAGGFTAVPYPVALNDTLASIATGLAAAVNSAMTAQNAAISAYSVGDTVVLSSTTKNNTTFTGSSSNSAGTAPGTETVTPSNYAKLFSDTGLFVQSITFDKDKMNKIPACTFEAKDKYGYYASSGSQTPNPTGGLGGLFTGAQDSKGAFICSNDSGQSANGHGRTLSATYATLKNNVTIIANAYPGLTIGVGTAGHQASELFSEYYSVLQGFQDTTDNSGNQISGSDNAYLQGGVKFVCSGTITQYVKNNGSFPSSAYLTAGYGIPAGKAPVYGPTSTFKPCNGGPDIVTNYSFGT